MKNILVFFLTLALGGSAQAAALSTNQIYQLNNLMGGPARAMQLGTKLNTIDTAPAIGSGIVTEAMLAAPTGGALYAHRIARAVFDPSGVVGHRTVAAHTLGVTLPAKAIITHSYIFTKTQLVDGGAGTLAIHCETANNIFSAADFTGSAAGAIVAGVSLGTVATMQPITSACLLTATVGGVALTAGKLDIFVEYVVAE